VTRRPAPRPERRPSRAERELRAGRLRRTAALVLVGVLAVGWFETARMGRTDALTEPKDTTVLSPLPPTTTSGSRADAVLMHLLPAGAQCHDQDRSRAVTRCEVAGIDVDYRLVGADRVRSVYRAAIGASAGAPRPAHGPPACARGAEDERAWSRPGTPVRVAGRYACRVEQGKAAMWWTVADRGLVAHSTAPDGDLPSLFAWWESHSER
jgi:hypothetical protein